MMDLRARLRAFTQQDFIRHNLVFLAGTLAIAVFSYLYYPVIGRLVSVSDFGEIQAWISLFMEFGIILTAFGYIVINIVNNHDEAPRKAILLVEIERLALFISLLVFLGLWAVSFSLKSSLQFTSALPFVALGALIILNVPATFRTYYLQGEKRLKDVALGGIIFTAGKLFLSVLLILVGFKLLGVVLGYILAQVANLAYVSYKTKGRVPSLKSSIPLRLSGIKFQTERKVLGREMLYGLFILILLLIVTILYTSDAIIVRRYFTAEQAGFFSGISSVARIVFFITASVAGVLIASVKIKNVQSENTGILTRSMLLVVGIGGLALLFFTLFPEFSVAVLIGQKYQAYSYLLPWLALSMLIGSLNNLLFSYQIAIRKFSALLPATVGIVLLVVTIAQYHDTLLHIAYDYIACNLVIFLITLVQIRTARSVHV